MQTSYQARRISKARADEVKRNRSLIGRVILLDTFNGFILVEPLESNLGEGDPLSLEEADYELQAVWHLGPKATLRDARRRLGLEATAAVGEPSAAGV